MRTLDGAELKNDKEKKEGEREKEGRAEVGHTHTSKKENGSTQ